MYRSDNINSVTHKLLQIPNVNKTIVNDTNKDVYVTLEILSKNRPRYGGKRLKPGEGIILEEYIDPANHNFLGSITIISYPYACKRVWRDVLPGVNQISNLCQNQI